jgi:hypothetical protein
MAEIKKKEPIDVDKLKTPKMFTDELPCGIGEPKILPIKPHPIPPPGEPRPIIGQESQFKRKAFNIKDLFLKKQTVNKLNVNELTAKDQLQKK